MFKKILATMCSALLLLQGTAVYAAPPQLNWVPPYSWQYTGNGEFVVPYTGNYRITVAGGQGAYLGDGLGTESYTQVVDVRLNKDAVIYYSVGSKGVAEKVKSECIVTMDPNATPTLLLPRGNDTYVSVNDSEIVRSYGGASACSIRNLPESYRDIMEITEYNCQSTTYYVHWHTRNQNNGRGCWNRELWQVSYWQPQWHFGPVDSHHNDSDYDNGHAGCYMYCKECYSSSPLGHMPKCHTGEYRTGEYWRVKVGSRYTDYNKPDTTEVGSFTGTYALGCKYAWPTDYGDGFIGEPGQDLVFRKTQAPYVGSPATAVSTTLNHTGNGYFKIELLPQDTVYFHNALLSNSVQNKYKDSSVRLIIKDDTVCFYVK